MKKRIIYIGRSRLHRNRANLIQTLHTVAALRDCDAEIALFLPPWKNECRLADKLADLGISEPLDVQSSRLLHSSWQPWGGRLFCRLKKRELLSADMVYARSPEISLLLAGNGIPHVFEVHEAQGLVNDSRYREIITHHRSGLVKHLFPISIAAREILSQAGVDAERMTVVPCGVDVAAYEQIPPVHPQNLQHPTVIYLGRLSRSRGLDIFLEVARAGLAEVVLVGDPEEPIADNCPIKVHPFVPHREVPAWYAKSDLVLLPYQESLEHANSISPLKLFEAMASGRPIIASDIPPIREVLIHNETALLVPAQDTLAWCDAIRVLSAEPQRALRLASSAQKHVTNFTWRARAEKILSLLHPDDQF
jgi:glycosyltransferase involved in cell wall biosynthesis